MDISKLEELLQLDKRLYFKNYEVKENCLYITPSKDVHTYKSTNEMLDIHTILEPLQDLYEIMISFEMITIKPKSELYE